MGYQSIVLPITIFLCDSCVLCGESNVVSGIEIALQARPNTVLAMISWGWEPLAFYQGWGSFPKTKKDMKGPSLALWGEQSALAPALLKMTRDTVIASPEFVERIQRHYALFRGKIDGNGSAGGPKKVARRR